MEVASSKIKQQTVSGWGNNLSNLSVCRIRNHQDQYKVIAKGWINLANPESGYDSASSRASIESKVGEYHDYAVYLNQISIRLEGLKLALVFSTYDLLI